MHIKKCLSIAISLQISIAAICQDTVWISKKGIVVALKDSAERYNVVYKSKSDTQQVKVVRYLNDGSVLEELNFYPYSPERILHGSFKRYNNNQVVDERIYNNNQLNGPHKTYWENGQLKRNDLYENGKFISGMCYRMDGTDTTWFEFERKASFPGGNDSLRKYLARHLRYPRLAKAEILQGTVKIKFTIAKDGFLEDIQVVNSVTPSLDNEAIRIVQQMPKWTPAIQDGRLVKMYFILPVVFRLNE